MADDSDGRHKMNQLYKRGPNEKKKRIFLFLCVCVCVCGLVGVFY